MVNVRNSNYLLLNCSNKNPNHLQTLALYPAPTHKLIANTQTTIEIDLNCYRSVQTISDHDDSQNPISSASATTSSPEAAPVILGPYIQRVHAIICLDVCTSQLLTAVDCANSALTKMRETHKHHK